MMKFKKISCNIIVLSLLLCSCGKKESLVNNVGAKEKEVKKSEIVESKKNNEIVESEEVIKLKSELAESQGALDEANQKVDYLLLGVILVPIVAAVVTALYFNYYKLAPLSLKIAKLLQERLITQGNFQNCRAKVLRLEALLDNAHIQH